MSIFKRETDKKNATNQSGLAEMALKNIHDGVIITNKSGVIQFINPAAVVMTECGSADKAIGLDYGLLLKLESKEGRELPESENPLIKAMNTGQKLDPFQACLITTQSNKRIPVAISAFPVDGLSQNRIITFRDITKELIEEGEQTEFISTASHEMRTPVATIDGYLSLALNPQTATIDDRARGYLNSAHAASQHLGKLFQDLLDITKLDDGKIRPNFEPVEMTELVKKISEDYDMRAKDAKLKFTFGSDQSSFGDNHQVHQVIYGFVDIGFMREILGNLIENAIKYTPEGGSIYVNVRGDGDRALINVTDTGIGISSDDLGHIFQKFYRADNSDTRTIGGTGLGLYLVKQRVEAMGGRVWAESAFGEGSTFFVSLPRITSEEYEKRMITVHNQQIQARLQAQKTQPQKITNAVSNNIVPQKPVPPVPPQSMAQTAPKSPSPIPLQTTPQTTSKTITPHPTTSTPLPSAASQSAPPTPPPSPPAAQISPVPQNNTNLNGVKQ